MGTKFDKLGKWKFQVTLHLNMTETTGNGFFCGYIGKVVKI